MKYQDAQPGDTIQATQYATLDQYGNPTIGKFLVLEKPKRSFRVRDIETGLVFTTTPKWFDKKVS